MVAQASSSISTFVRFIHHQDTISLQAGKFGALRFPLAAVLLALVGAACSEGDRRVAPSIPEFQEPPLQEGRGVWMQVCRNCHLMGVAGAPAIGDYTAWRPRAARGTAALYSSAIEGIRGEAGWKMPPRGGNDALSDQQVRLAVDFMLAAAHEPQGKQPR